ncbi:uncharacterized protein B0P05DRAFT_469093 [Gilbertella persicaria]|uniref:uncharacterized protein n=1 Tax=Gilbertella persicaria TaxID=101096 RepID=UPI002220E0C8|nr:uncharacterized protein B0P05DRAFT_469093 [Gilbertella persicaria]KAI8080686.1 hypothetical protein B0P05DRAFT_469093 [Gilbertella persicaria]
MIDNVPKSPRYNQTSPDLPLTPTTSSSSNLNSSSHLANKPLPPRTPKEPDCPCHHILVSKDSQHCALCDDIIPILAEIQDDREKKRDKINETKQLLSNEQSKLKQQQQDIEALNKKCIELTDKLKNTTEQYQSLQNDLVVLEKKYETEKIEAEQAKKDKTAVENELEDLSQRLFEEANDMVANEKREKHQLEIQYNHLQDELKLCREQIEAEELQLKELKQKFGSMEENREKRFSDNNSSTTSLRDSASVEDENVPTERASRDMAGLFTHKDNNLEIQETTDPTILNEFKEFVQLDESVPIRKLHNATLFMRHSLAEDVEPCLRFGPNARLSPKKLYEAILLNTCFIEEAPYEYAQEQAKRPYDVPLRISAAKSMIWERLSNAPMALFTGCQACGRVTKDLPYRFRISMLDDWACVDRYCRDRLVAVCEFYTFIRNIRQGYYNGRTVSDLYGESIRLKLQMFYASRMGTLSQTLHNMGIKGDMVGQASPPNMVIPSPTIENEDKASLADSTAESNISQRISEDEEEKPSVHPGNSVWIEL